MPDVEVWEPYAGSDDPVVRKQWRKNRQAAYRLGYKEREGKQHPASRRKAEKSAEKMLLEATEPPKNMGWNDFGILWDLDPEHPFLPRLRTKGSVEEQWDARYGEHMSELEIPVD